jgi:hypothetical protein
VKLGYIFLVTNTFNKGSVSTLAGAPQPGAFADGNGTAAKFYSPHGIYYDETTKSLLVSDYSNCKIRRVQLNGSFCVFLCHFSFTFE